MQPLRHLLRPAACVLLIAGLSACGLVYKLPTRQGNVLDQDKLDRVEVGMSRSQIRFLLGTPLAASPFTEDRWDYIGFYRSPRGRTAKRVVSFYFEGDQLARAEGLKPESERTAEAAEPEAVREDLEAFGSAPLPERDTRAPEDIIRPPDGPGPGPAPGP
jgi:outer membrane protein assembly factor BamE